MHFMSICSALISTSIKNITFCIKVIISFAKAYANLREIIVNAVRNYVNEVREDKFPGPGHTRYMKREEYEELLKKLKSRAREV